MRSQDWIWIQLPRAVQLGQYSFLLHSQSCLVWSRRTASVVSHSNFHQRRKLAAYQYCKKLENFWGLEGKDLVSVVLLFVCFYGKGVVREEGMELTTHKNELHFYKQNKCSQLPVSQNHFVPSPLCNHDRHTQTCSGFICQGAGIRGRYRVASVRGDGGQPCARHSRFQLVTASSSWSQLVPASSTTAPPPSLSLSAMLVASPGKHSSKEKNAAHQCGVGENKV